MKLQYIFILFAITLFSSCDNKTVTPEENVDQGQGNLVTLTEAQMKNAGVKTGKASIGKMNNALKVSGVVDVPPQNMVSISFPLGGYLKSTHLLEGIKVKKGEKIAIMEHQSLIQLQEDYLVAKSKSYFLQKDYERQKALNVNKSASDKVLEQTESDYQMQKIITNSLKEKLRLIGLNPDHVSENNISRSINIYSPINGYVSAVNVNIGKFVNPSDVLFELVNPTDLHLALKVFEKDIHNIEIGQNIHAYMANNPDKIFEAEVILVSKNLDADRTAIVHCHFEKPEHELLPGMFLNAEIETISNDAVLVPEEAVVRFGEKEYIFLERGERRFELTEVKVGNASVGKVEVLNQKLDLTQQSIIVANAYSVLMKMQNKGEE